MVKKKYYAKTSQHNTWIKLETTDLTKAKDLAQAFFKPATKIYLSQMPDDLISEIGPGFNIIAEYANGTWTATA